MKSFSKLLIGKTLIITFCIIFSGCKSTQRAKVENFTVNIKSPQITIGEIELQLETILGLGKLRKQSVPVLYFPQEDAVCLQYRFEFYNYHQFWSKRGRLSFLSALQQYNIDYDARNLQRSGRSLQKYGSVRGYLAFQRSSITVQAHANMNVDLGYNFKEGAPYFTIYQHEAYYLDDMSKDDNRTSPNITMYFTRAQAAELAELFEQYITVDMNIPGEDKETGTLEENDDIPRDVY